MIKLIYAITRRADISAEAFRNDWLNRHAPLVVAQSEALNLRRYVQNHLIEHPANAAFQRSRGMLPALDGIAELWWNSLADMLAALATNAGARGVPILSEDEEKLVDISRSAMFLTKEHLIFDKSGGNPSGADGAKIAFLLTRKDGLSTVEYQTTWLRDHAPLAEASSDACFFAKYVQNHSITPEMNEQWRTSRGGAAAYDGLTEIWLNSLGDLKRGVESERGRTAAAALLEDERRFVQFDRSRCFLTREHLIFDRPE